MSFTITYDDRVKGFTSFHSFVPEMTIGLGTNFYSFKSGTIYRHHSDNVNRCNFYETDNDSSITVVFNDAPSDDKIYLSMVTESNRALKATLNTNLNEDGGVLETEDFNSRESRFFAHIRNNEKNLGTTTSPLTSFTGKMLGGGKITNMVVEALTSGSPSVLNCTSIPQELKVGDLVYIGIPVGDSPTQWQYKGEITLISRAAGQIRIEDTNGTLTDASNIGCIVMFAKNQRIDGSNLRGYYLEAQLVDTGTDAVELFSVSVNAKKSFV